MKLTILMRGVAAKAGNILTYGSHWGDDVIVSSLALRDLRHASALSYVEVATLSREDLDAVLASFPQAQALVRQAAMRVAMKRAVVIISGYVRSKKTLTTAATSDVLRTNLTSAFGYETMSADATLVLRIMNLMTGKNLKDIDRDGFLVEEVDTPTAKADATGVEPKVEHMRSELAEVKRDVAEIKEMLRAMSRPAS